MKMWRSERKARYRHRDDRGGDQYGEMTQKEVETLHQHGW